MDDIQGVDDIAKRLAHLPAMSVTHDRMEIDLGARGKTDSEAMTLPVLMALPSLPTWNHGFLVALLARRLSVSDKCPLGRGSPGPDLPKLILANSHPRRRHWGGHSHLHTSLKGSFPVSLRPSMTIRATQKKRMSWPVSSRVPG